MRRTSAAAFLAMALGLAAAPGALAAEGIHKIQHVVVIMQENRSFDSYFGTYPVRTAFLPTCACPIRSAAAASAPFHDPDDENYGGPHGHEAFTADLDGGKMDGFVGEAEKGLQMLGHRTRLQPLHRTAHRARSAST